MNTEELKKLLKDNRIHFYSYWGKNKLIDLARINKLIPEPEPEKPEPEEPETPKNVSWQRLKNIRNSQVNVKLIDIETKEEKTFPSIYKPAQYLDKSPQTIRHFGKRKGIWNKKYQIITEEEQFIYVKGKNSINKF